MHIQNNMKALKTRKSPSDKYTENTLCLDAVAVIVNKANPNSNLSKAQVEKIFTGNTKKWNQLGK